MAPTLRASTWSLVRLLAVVLVLAWTPSVGAVEPGSGATSSSATATTTPTSKQIPTTYKADLKPLAAGITAVASHAPYASGECGLCHVHSEPENPGPLLKPGNGLCLECHEEFPKVMARKFVHTAAQAGCVTCHNPHDSLQPKLLVAKIDTLCFQCHDSIQAKARDSAVRHGALTEGAQCLTCHDAHGANVEHLLHQMPRNLCLGCHNRDDVVDASGRKLRNTRHELETHPLLHGALNFGDCSACHNPHGYEHYRLLNKEYPQEFYSTYNTNLYALCFECHESAAFTEPETDALTNFRNGTRNLHYLHVNKEEMGRTCRACHEVHAAKLPHLIREKVPYGSSGWMLKINFTDTPNGGSCTKTCHGQQSYTNSLAAPTPSPP